MNLNNNESNKQKPTNNFKKLKLTGWQNIVTCLLAGAFVCYLFLATFNLFGWAVPIVPWTLAAEFFLLAVANFVYTYWFKKQVKKRAVTPSLGYWALVQGKSTLFVGMFLAGAHIVYVLEYISNLDIPAPRDRVIHGIAAVITAILFSISGAKLERACLIDSSNKSDSEDDLT